MEVMVVLPWQPATATTCENRSDSWPSASLRSSCGMPRSAASTRSGLSGRMAAE